MFKVSSLILPTFMSCGSNGSLTSSALQCYFILLSLSGAIWDSHWSILVLLEWQRHLPKAGCQVSLSGEEQWVLSRLLQCLLRFPDQWEQSWIGQHTMTSFLSLVSHTGLVLLGEKSLRDKEASWTGLLAGTGLLLTVWFCPLPCLWAVSKHLRSVNCELFFPFAYLPCCVWAEEESIRCLWTKRPHRAGCLLQVDLIRGSACHCKISPWKNKVPSLVGKESVLPMDSPCGGVGLTWYWERDSCSIPEEMRLPEMPSCSKSEIRKHRVWLTFFCSVEGSKTQAAVLFLQSWGPEPSRLLLLLKMFLSFIWFSLIPFPEFIAMLGWGGWGGGWNQGKIALYHLVWIRNNESSISF